MTLHEPKQNSETVTSYWLGQIQAETRAPLEAEIASLRSTVEYLTATVEDLEIKVAELQNDKFMLEQRMMEMEYNMHVS